MGYTKTCVVCGRATWMLNDEDKCEWCAKKDEKSTPSQKSTSSTGTTQDQRR